MYIFLIPVLFIDTLWPWLIVKYIEISGLIFFVNVSN